MARVVKKGTCRYKLLRALTILVRFKKKNGAYTEKEKIPPKKYLSIRASEGGRVARIAKKGTCRYKMLRALTILIRFKKNNGACTEIEHIPKKFILSVRAFKGGRLSRVG